MNFSQFENNERFQRTFPQLEAALENKEIYNVDFQSVKDGLNRIFEKKVDAAKNPFYKLGNHPDSEVIWATAYGLYQANSGLKKLQKINQVVSERQAAFKEIIEIHEQGAALWDMIKEAKAFVVKGRKPSTNPRKTPARTLDNTGTCPVCSMNVKLSVGKIVDHGYRVIWNQQQGNCFGVGFEPFEVSPEGTKRYLKALKNSLVGVEQAIDEINKARLFSTSEPDMQSKYKFEAQQQHLKSDITFFEKKIVGWKVCELPKEDVI